MTELNYYSGLFDCFKQESDLDKWVDFPNVMWGLGFEMDSGKSFEIFKNICGIVLKTPHNEREDKRNKLFLLEHAPLHIVGNYLFSHWRYLTHWIMAPYSEYDIDFLVRVINILESKYESMQHP